MTKVKDAHEFAATGTEKTALVNEAGLINSIILVVPNFTNVITATLTIHDEDGNELYNSTAKAKNATYVITGLAVPVHYGFSSKVTLSGNAGGSGGTVSVALFVDTRA